jgi:hypothetical protein
MLELNRWYFKSLTGTEKFQPEKYVLFEEKI